MKMKYLSPTVGGILLVGVVGIFVALQQSAEDPSAKKVSPTAKAIEQQPEEKQPVAANLPAPEARFSDTTKVGDLENNLSEILEIDEFYERTEKLRALFARWAELDPQSAADKLVELEPKFRDYEVLEMVAVALAQKNVNAGLIFAQQIDETDYRMSDFIRKHTLTVWSSTDPKAAAEYVLTNVPTKQQGRVLGDLVEGWGYESPEEAMAFANTISEGSARDAFIAKAFDGMVKRNPEEATKHFSTLSYSDKSRNAAAGIISVEWSQSDPEAAVNWASSLDHEDPARQAALLPAYSTWSRKDPVAASKLLTTLEDGIDRDRTIAVFVEGAAEVDPEGSTAWARSIQRHDIRRWAFRAIANHYASKSPQEARQWLSTVNDLPEDWVDGLSRQMRLEEEK